MSLKAGSMRESINNIYTVLREDETLMRILHYPPRDRAKGYLDPLDVALDDIVNESSDKYWDIVDKTIRKSEKTTDIQKDALCRLYIHPGRRRPVFGNYLLADQEIVVDVYVNEKFSKDDRLSWICDKVNELIVHERLAAYGKLEFAAGNPRVAPIGYSLYELVYKYTANKK